MENHVRGAKTFNAVNFFYILVNYLSIFTNLVLFRLRYFLQRGVPASPPALLDNIYRAERKIR